MSDDTLSLQARFAPQTTCFGCGPANSQGLQIGSYVEGDDIVLDWTPKPHHEAFPGFVSGGIIGVLFDCHCNWTAAYHLMRQAGADAAAGHGDLRIQREAEKPTPSHGPLRLRARVVESTEDRAVVESTLEAEGMLCASCRGTFVAVKPGHPAYQRW